MNRSRRRKLQKAAKTRLLIFTFLGAFILFFTVFSILLPIITPKVEIPALTEEHVFNSITSHDFRGRIDPRLHSIELQEEGITSDDPPEPEALPKQAPKPVNTVITQNQPRPQIETPPAPVIPLPGQKKVQKEIVQPAPVALQQPPLPDAKQTVTEVAQSPVLNVPPPRPKLNTTSKQIAIVPPAPIFQAKVIIGDFSSPNEAKTISDLLVNLDYKPFIRERNGNYILQLGSYTDAEQAKALVKELKDQNFDAKIIYE